MDKAEKNDLTEKIPEEDGTQISQSTKHIMVNEWSFMYTFDSFQNVFIKENLIVCYDCPSLKKNLLFLLFHNI